MLASLVWPYKEHENPIEGGLTELVSRSLCYHEATLFYLFPHFKSLSASLDCKTPVFPNHSVHNQHLALRSKKLTMTQKTLSVHLRSSVKPLPTFLARQHSEGNTEHVW